MFHPHSKVLQFCTTTTTNNDENTTKYWGVINNLFLSYARPRNSTDDTPCLRVNDIHKLLVSIGENPLENLLRDIFGEVDSDENGTIDFHEFRIGFDRIMKNNEGNDDDSAVLDVSRYIESFRTLDRDGNGILTHDELSGLLSTTGGHLDSSSASEILSLADKDGNGSIDLSEFIDFLTNRSHTHYSWRLLSGFRVVLVIGGPGSGKGVLCDRLKNRAGVRHYSSGESLRDEVSSGSCLGRSIESTLQEGKLVPSTTMIALVKKKIMQFPGELLALDGFPRTTQNYHDFDEICGTPEFAIHIQVPDDIMMERILKRGQAKGGRSDDNSETAKLRIETFHKLTKPTLEALHRSNITIHTLDGTDTPEGVWNQLLSLETPIRHRLDFNSL